MTYREAPRERQRLINQAKSRALARLQTAHANEYMSYYEGEMRKLGYVRIPLDEMQTTGHRERGGWRKVE